MTGKQAIKLYEQVERAIGHLQGVLFRATMLDSDAMTSDYDIDTPEDMDSTLEDWGREIAERIEEIQVAELDKRMKKNKKKK